MSRVFNFNPGPAALPEEVLKEVQAELLDYKGTGMSVMEMSHRSPEFKEIMDDAKSAMKRIMGLDDRFKVLFLQGGASTQFLMVPMNLCPDDKVANYVDTGAWSSKALKEAKKIGKKMHVAASSEDKEYTYIPKNINLSDNPAYLHITYNNTIRGTEYHDISHLPTNVPLIADMSSDFLSKPVDFQKFALIYAGAQKNIGPAGVTVVIIREDMEEKLNSGLPTMLDYKTHIDKDSAFNTPPVFAIYVVGKVLHWIEKQGGLKSIAEMNREKAAYIYDILDSSSFYRGTVVKEDRSFMNIPFRLPNEELEAKFVKEAKERGMVGLKGHRSVGGIRVSLYNAVPMEGAKKLAEFMKEFEKANS